jgi:hypothetical protein
MSVTLTCFAEVATQACARRTKHGVAIVTRAAKMGTAVAINPARKQSFLCSALFLSHSRHKSYPVVKLIMPDLQWFHALSRMVPKPGTVYIAMQ